MVEEDDEITEESKGNAMIMAGGFEMYQLLEDVVGIEQVSGSPCPLCGGGFNHKESCIVPKAEKLLAKIKVVSV